MNNNQKISWNYLQQFHKKSTDNIFSRNNFVLNKYKIFKFILKKNLI